MFDWPGPDVTFTTRAAPSGLLALPFVLAPNVGLNGSAGQPVTPYGLDTPALALPTPSKPPKPVIVALTASGAQLVGLNSNSGRSTVTLICLSWTEIGRASCRERG